MQPTMYMKIQGLSGNSRDLPPPPPPPPPPPLAIMYMKINRLSLNCRSKTKLGEEVARGGQNPKDVKYADRTDNVHENKGWYDRMTDNYSGFCAWSALFLRKWSTIDRALWPKMHKWR